LLDLRKLPRDFRRRGKKIESRPTKLLPRKRGKNEKSGESQIIAEKLNGRYFLLGT